MVYVELLRLRKSLMWYTGVFAALYVIFLLSIHAPGATVHIGGDISHDHNGSIPLGALLAGLAWCPMIFATVLGVSLNRENEGVEMVWTKPVARERLALGYILVDLGAIVVAYFIALAFVMLVLATLGLTGLVVVDASAARNFGLGLGIAFMWYGLLQAATAWNRGRAGLVVGLSWAVFIVLAPLARIIPAGTWLHTAVVLINYVNPMAYMSAISSHSAGATNFSGIEVRSLNDLSFELRFALVWTIGVVASVIAIFSWKRMEV
jgi:hypothetical protein